MLHRNDCSTVFNYLKIWILVTYNKREYLGIFVRKNKAWEMVRSLPPLNALKAFEVAGRHLSFTKAAAELNVTPAAISHQVKALEELLLQRREEQTSMRDDQTRPQRKSVIVPAGTEESNDATLTPLT